MSFQPRIGRSVRAAENRTGRLVVTRTPAVHTDH